MTWAKTATENVRETKDRQIKVAVFASRPLICWLCRDYHAPAALQKTMTIIYNDNDLQPNKITTPFEQVVWADFRQDRLPSAWTADVVYFERNGDRRMLKNRHGSLSDELAKPFGDKILEAELIQ